MPIYVYDCETCGQAFERRQSISAPPIVDCPECGGHVHRVIQPVGIVFKGSGFYVTDNKKTSSTALPGERKSGATKDKGSSDTTKLSDSSEATSSD